MALFCAFVLAVWIIASVVFVVYLIVDRNRRRRK